MYFEIGGKKSVGLLNTRIRSSQELKKKNQPPKLEKKVEIEQTDKQQNDNGEINCQRVI